MDNGLGRKLVNTIAMGVATARGLGTGSFGVPVFGHKEGVGQCPSGFVDDDSRLGHGFWMGGTSGLGQGMIHMVLWISCRHPGLDWARELGTGLGTEFVNGVQ